jgi:hypothetical protein
VPPAKKRTSSRRPTKAERLQRAKDRRALRWRLTVITLLVVGLAVFVTLNRSSEDDVIVDAAEASGACSYDTVTDEDPPASGDVDAADPAEPGFYTTDDEAPSDLALLRAMRQGFVVLWYEPSVDTDDLLGLSERFGRDLIVVSRPGLSVPVALTAWERRLLCERIDDAAAARFVEGFRDRAPEKGFL